MHFIFQRLIEIETCENKNIECLTTIQADKYNWRIESLFSMMNKVVHVTINGRMHVWLIELRLFHIQSYEFMNIFLPNTDIEFGLNHTHTKQLFPASFVHSSNR